MPEGVALVLLGAVLGIEGTSFGQFMLSRPVAAGVLAGLLTGDPTQGLMIGALVEVYYLPAVPVGGGRFPEPGPSTVVGVYAGSLAGGAGGLAMGVLFALTFGLLGGWTQEKARAWTVGRLPGPEAPDLARRLAVAQWTGVAVAGFRGLVSTAFGIVLARSLLPALAPWPLDARATWVLLILAGCIPLGSLLAILGGVRRQARWVLLGTMAGVALGVLT